MAKKSTTKRRVHRAKPPGGPEPDSTLALASTRSIALADVATRREHDLLGEVDVPADAYWGVHTLRAVANFPITGVSIGHFPDLVRALALVKQAAARANRRLGQLSAGQSRGDRPGLRSDRWGRALPRPIRRRRRAGRRRHFDQYERQ